VAAAAAVAAANDVTAEAAANGVSAADAAAAATGTRMDMIRELFDCWLCSYNEGLNSREPLQSMHATGMR
jgi:hypothetical protein